MAATLLIFLSRMLAMGSTRGPTVGAVVPAGVEIAGAEVVKEGCGGIGS